MGLHASNVIFGTVRQYRAAINLIANTAVQRQKRQHPITLQVSSFCLLAFQNKVVVAELSCSAFFHKFTNTFSTYFHEVFTTAIF